MQTPPTLTFRDDINALRAVAVALVVLYHFGVEGFAGGFVGVDLFFVISGYLMTAIIATRLADGSFSLTGFLVARALRIWPALAVLVLTMQLAGAWLLPPMDLEDLGRQARSALVFTSNHFFDRGQGYFQVRPDERWLLHTWSLSVEWQFYLLYPLVLLGVAWLARRFGGARDAGLRRSLLATLLVLTLASFALSLWLVQTASTTAFFALGSRAWQFTAGGLVFFLVPWAQRLSPTVVRAMRWAAAGLLLVLMLRAYAPSLEGAWPGPWALLPVAAAMLVILAGSGSTSASAGPAGLAQRAVAALGRWSYSIYLWHWPVMVTLRLSQADREHPVVSIVGGVALSVLLGALSFRHVESAFRGGRDRSARRPRVAVAAGGMLAGYALAQAAVATDGLPVRVADDAAFYALHQSVADERIFPRKCSNFKRGSAAFETCSLHPDLKEGRVLVIGDSHAQHFHAWFAGQRDVGVDFFTAAGCPIARNVNARDAGYRCHAYADEAFHRALDARYRLVVISNRWNRWDSETPSLCVWRDGSCQHGDRAQLRSAGVEQARRDIRELLEHGREVLLIDDTPEAPFHVPRMRMRQRFLGLPVDDRIDDPPRDPAAYFESLWRSLEGHPRLHRLDFRSLLCREGRCRIAEAATGRPIFVDHGHFSPPWIAVHGEPLRPYVVPRASR